MITASLLFNLNDFHHAAVFSAEAPVWQALDTIKSYMDGYPYPPLERKLLPDGRPLPETVILHHGRWISASGLTIHYGDTSKGKLLVTGHGQPLEGATVVMAGAVLLGEQIALGQGVLIESQAMIKSPAIIGDRSEVRQAAYLRGYCLAGQRCVLGHATEIKNAIFLNDAKAGHFAYLGDSILGNDVNLGAGTKFANLRFIKGNIHIRYQGQLFDTGRRKFGAILGDNCQTGCNSVTSPGTIFSRDCMLMPNATAPAGFHAERSLLR